MSFDPSSVYQSVSQYLPSFFGAQKSDKVSEQADLNKAQNQNSPDDVQADSVNLQVASQNSALAKSNEQSSLSNLNLEDDVEVSKASSVKMVEKNQSNDDMIEELAKDATRCSDLFYTAMTSQKTPEHIKDVLRVIDNSYASSTFSRNGEVLDKSKFTREMFHAALLHGAHVVVEDHGLMAAKLLEKGKESSNGMLSYMWNGGKQAYEGHFYSRNGIKESSHYGNNTKQWGADLGHALEKQDYFTSKNGGWMGHLLMGKTDQGHSFIQFENNGISNYTDKYVHHSKDYLDHRASNWKQVGPQGKIDASEKQGKENHFVLKPSVQQNPDLIDFSQNKQKPSDNNNNNNNNNNNDLYD